MPIDPDESIYGLQGVEGPWGDYGDILLHGMVGGPPDDPDRLYLERCGPWIPPISFPVGWDIVVTDETRERLAGAFPALRFGEVVKHRIVKLAWHTWDRTKDDPERYPAGYEPENYVLGRKHSHEMAEALGVLWTLEHDIVPGVEVGGSLAVRRDVLTDALVFSAYALGRTFVREPLAVWLRNHYGDWVRLRKAAIV